MEILEGKYAITMDMYPQQSKEWTRIHTFFDNLRENRLTTTVCKDCGEKAFPPRVVCPNCMSENLEWVDLPTRGRVIVVSEEEIGVPVGFETPLIHALIDLGGELTMMVRIDGVKMGELKEGDEVILHVFPVPPAYADGKKGAVITMERVFFCFRKA